VVPHAGGAFECPSLILLRQRTADAVGEHWGRLEGLITFGMFCSTRLARMALTRMLARMCGLGGGMSPLLAPQVLEGLLQALLTVVDGAFGEFCLPASCRKYKCLQGLLVGTGGMLLFALCVGSTFTAVVATTERVPAGRQAGRQAGWLAGCLAVWLADTTRQQHHCRLTHMAKLTAFRLTGTIQGMVSQFGAGA